MTRNTKPGSRYTLTANYDWGQGQIDISISSVRTIEGRKVIRNERVTAADHYQDTRLITFETGDSNLTFEEGEWFRFQL